jgi:hypothetical protein
MSAGFPEGLFEGAEEPPRRRSYGKGATLAVVAVAYLTAFGFGVFVVLSDLLGWAGDNVTLFGITPSSTGAREGLRHDILTFTRLVTCLAAIGVVLGLWWRRREAVVVFGAGAGVALVLGLTGYAMAAKDKPSRPAWEDAPHYCQEHSGEPNTCPGD